jgi:GMP synthase-like glutamine amidotransferase
MKLGILETGKMAPPLEDVHGDFPAMFRNWLTPHMPDVEFTTYNVVDGEWPNGPDACDGWLITGSRFGVYDPEPFIEPLKQFIRDCADAGKPQLGICFGHQIVAEAMGGRAVKSDKGWGTGIQHYSITTNGTATEWPLLVSHQDQVTEVPPTAEVIGGTEFCPFGVLAYDAPILTAQFHPEITPGLSADIIRMRSGTAFPEETAAAALDSLATPPANDAAGAWMGAWLMERMAD